MKTLWLSAVVWLGACGLLPGLVGAATLEATFTPLRPQVQHVTLAPAAAEREAVWAQVMDWLRAGEAVRWQRQVTLSPERRWRAAQPLLQEEFTLRYDPLSRVYTLTQAAAVVLTTTGSHTVQQALWQVTDLPLAANVLGLQAGQRYRLTLAVQAQPLQPARWWHWLPGAGGQQLQAVFTLRFTHD